LAVSADVRLVVFSASEAAPFEDGDARQSSYGIYYVDFRDSIKTKELLEKLALENIDVVIVSGWHHKPYIRIVKSNSLVNAVKVLAFDWQWRPTFRNIIKACVGRVWRSRIFDAAFVPGPRQAVFASIIGFHSSRIYTGLYSADTDTFKSLPWYLRDNSVVFVGRLVEEKGCSFLASAWLNVVTTNSVPADWRLKVYGVGPLMPLFVGLPQCDVLGFQQPRSLAEAVRKAKILCAPSLYEPWGVQLHEAVSAGLAIVATNCCGAAKELVKPGVNGYLVPVRDAKAIAVNLAKLIQVDSVAQFGSLENMSFQSTAISRKFSPRSWAEAVHQIHRACCS
jgi:glycosyltransferase involved in cell wall biosynthesis